MAVDRGSYIRPNADEMREREGRVLALLRGGKLTQAEIARQLSIPPGAVHYIRRKHGLPPLWTGRKGVRQQAHCRYGHRFTPGSFLEVKRSRGYVERRCKECRRIQNAGRRRGGSPTKADLISLAHR